MPPFPVVEHPGELDLLPEPHQLATQPPRATILLAEPTHYAVTREDNPHTVGADGQLNTVDPEAAHRQWTRLRDAVAGLGFDIETVDGAPGLPDLVFCANTAFPYLSPYDGKPSFVPGRMRYEGRRGEIPVLRDHLEGLGYEPTPLPDGLAPFECGGDVLWLGRRRLLIAGTGERTSRNAIEALADLVEAPAVRLELVDPDFYHLDTCLAVLDEDTLAWVPAAFAEHSRSLIEELPVETVEVPEDEARATLACNLHCPDGEHVLIDEANQQTTAILEERGYEVLGLHTSEFRKAGGSVFCMTNQLW